jgi:5-methylcytosine-specific restriction endonuclease McrA
MAEALRFVPLDHPQTAYDQLRQRVLQRDAWTCQCCGSRSNLEVHHKELRGQGADDSEQNKTTLCVKCHSLVHPAPNLSYK